MSYPTKLFKILTSVALAVVLASCGGGGASFGDGGEGGGDGGGEKSEYTLSTMAIGLNNLSAGGSTGVTVKLRDENSDLAKTNETVTFSSECISNGTATIDTSVDSENGVFTTTYLSKGCEGNDRITASYKTQSSAGTVNVLPANLGAVEFVSATPENILLKGMSAPGKQHTSVVIFQIKNDVGGPIPDEDVTFALSTSIGGITLSSTTSTTNANGIVSTTLQAGTINTPVRVRATVNRGGVEIVSESSLLVISTGIADQNSLSISVSNHNPSGWNHDGEKVSVIIHASDRFNNPVPDGTAVSFNTELGQIEPSCQTTNGVCTVDWTSSNPRDLGTLDARYPRDTTTSNSDGITTITATLIGEESFIDTNSNGIFDDGDGFDSLSDRGEMFEDYNRNYDIDGDGTIDNTFDSGFEKYLDYNGDGIYNPKDGKYTGISCADSSRCSAATLKNIFTSIEVVMAEDHQKLTIWDDSTGTKDGIWDSADTKIINSTIHNDILYLVEVAGVRNNQTPPSGTTIATTSEEAKVIVGSATLGSNNSHRKIINAPRGGYFMHLKVTDGDPLVVENGTIVIAVKTPKGLSVSLSYTYIDD